MKSALFLDLDKTIIPFASEQEFVGYLFRQGMVSLRRLGELMRFFLAHRLGLIRDYREAKRTSARIVMAGKDLGADGWYAIEPEVRGGIFTGELREPVLFSEEKERVVRELALTRHLDLKASYAYSDSHLDEPMLAAVGHPVAVNPDRKLAALAYRLSWPVVRWHLPRPA